MSWPDLINGAFELVGALLTWRNYQQLRQDRTVAGVYWPTTAFFAGWGLWNLIYYPALGQWASFAGGVLLVAGNIAWVVLALQLQRAELLVDLSWKLVRLADAIVSIFRPNTHPYRAMLRISNRIDRVALELWRKGKAAA